MISLGVFKDLYEKITDVVGLPVNIYDERGICIVGVNEGSSIPMVNYEEFFNYDNYFVVNDWTYKNIKSKGEFLCCVSMKGSSPEIQKYMGLIELLFTGVKRTEFNKISFIRDIIEGKDINIEKNAEKLGQTIVVDRMVMIIKMNSSYDEVREMLRNMFPDDTKELLVDLDTDKIMLLKNKEDNDEMQNVALTISDTLTTELYEKVLIAIGGISKSLYDLKKVYKKAETALALGEIFEDKDRIFDYEQLGLKRLISQIPIEIERAYIKEIFKEREDFLTNEELYQTAVKFFDSNLNISEASRNLFIHRNTLVYRLDKIQRLLSLDLRNFNDAVILKLALMFDEYIKYVEKNALTDT